MPSVNVMPKLSSVLSSMELSQVAKMNARVNAEKKEGVIRLAGGEPSLPLPAEIFAEIAADPKFLRYSPIDGFPELRERLLGKLAAVNGLRTEHLSVICTPGGCGGLSLSLRAILDRGDEVLIPDPCWEYMSNIIRLAGGVAVRYRVPLAGDGAPDELAAALQEKWSERVTAVLVNTPSNPTGRVLDQPSLEALARFCDRHGLWLLSDEVTEAFVYDGRQHLSPALVYDKSIVVHSFSKSYGLTGLRLGYVAAPERVVAEIRKAALYSVMYPSSIAQSVALSILERDHVGIMQAMRERFQRSRDLFVARLAELPFLTVDPPQGGLFVLPRFDEAVGEGPIHELIYERCRIAAAPGYAFGSRLDRHLRMFLGVDDHVIHEVVDRLATLAPWPHD